MTRFSFHSQGADGEVVLDFFEPGSSAAFTDCVFTGNNFCNFTTPVSGTWKITLVPAGASRQPHAQTDLTGKLSQPA